MLALQLLLQTGDLRLKGGRIHGRILRDMVFELESFFDFLHGTYGGRVCGILLRRDEPYFAKFPFPQHGTVRPTLLIFGKISITHGRIQIIRFRIDTALVVVVVVVS